MKKFFLTILILFFSMPVFAKEFSFAQISDIHFSSVKTKSSRDLSEANQALEWAIRSMNNRDDIDFVVFLGDNIDKSNPKDLLKFLNIVRKLNKPYYIVIGNHDAYKVSGVPKEDYEKVVGLVNTRQKDGFPTFSFDIDKNFEGIILDGTVHFVASSHGIFEKPVMVWLDKKLKKLEKKDKSVLIFQHFPLKEPYENKSHEILDKTVYYKVLNSHKNVVSISSGHYHDGKVQKEEISKNYSITHISCPSLLNPPHVYQIVSVKYKKPAFRTVKDITIDVKNVDLK